MAVLSKVAICNMALTHIGSQSQIESLDENTKEARLCKRWYDEARLETLEAFDWDFARAEVDLSAHSDDPPFDWVYRYQYPVCAKFRGIVNPSGRKDDPVPFKRYLSADKTQATICTNCGPTAKAWVTADVEAVEMFDRHFAHTLSRRIASYIAFDITGDRDIEKAQYQIWAAMSNQAMAASANGEQEEAPRDADWIRLR